MAAVLTTSTIPSLFSLDEARAEIRERWGNVELRQQIQEELGENFMPAFSQAPRGVLFQQLCSPGNGFTFFFQCANYVNAVPLVLEYHGDKFVHFNEEKKGLGRLRVVLEDGTRARVDIMEFHKYEMKALSDIAILKTGESLVEFHHGLFDVSGYRVELHDNTAWFSDFGGASGYYYSLLLHFLAHGVLFESFFVDEGEREMRFTHDVVMPAIHKLEQRYGLKPLIVGLYPESQDEAEDFYWWCYPPHVNDYIIKYAETHSLPLRDVAFEQDHRPQPKIESKETQCTPSTSGPTPPSKSD